MGICLFKVSNRNTKTKWEICSKLQIKTPEHASPTGVFILNSEHISHLVLVSQLLILFVNVSTCWVVCVNPSKDAFYITYSDIKKRIRIDFTVYKIQGIQISQCISYISKCSKQMYNVEFFGRYFSFCPRLIRRNRSCLFSFRLQYLVGFKENLRVGYSQNHKQSIAAELGIMKITMNEVIK